MVLHIQIYSLLYSFIFGTVLYFLLEYFNKIEFKKHTILKLIVSLFFMIAVSWIYFLGLLFINNGYVHIYFLLAVVVGYIIVYYFNFTLVNKKK